VATGDLIEKVSLPASLHQLSIRHMAESADGTIWFGGQYEGAATDTVDLVGTHRPGGIAPDGTDFFISDGHGRLWQGRNPISEDPDIAWDNHVRRIG